MEEKVSYQNSFSGSQKLFASCGFQIFVPFSKQSALFPVINHLTSLKLVATCSMERNATFNIIPSTLGPPYLLIRFDK
jgi:folate-dependent tRNA-U54 methylase TrmFO/GidA